MSIEYYEFPNWMAWECHRSSLSKVPRFSPRQILSKDIAAINRKGNPVEIDPNSEEGFLLIKILAERMTNMKFSIFSFSHWKTKPYGLGMTLLELIAKFLKINHKLLCFSLEKRLTKPKTSRKGFIGISEIATVEATQSEKNRVKAWRRFLDEMMTVMVGNKQLSKEEVIRLLKHHPDMEEIIRNFQIFFLSPTLSYEEALEGAIDASLDRSRDLAPPGIKPLLYMHKNVIHYRSKAQMVKDLSLRDRKRRMRNRQNKKKGRKKP